MSFVCLAYHRISDDPAARADPYAVAQAHFVAQMTWLARRGYEVVSLGQALAGRSGPSRGRRRLALSFDDGYRDFQSCAWPVLQSLGFGATLFVVAGKAGGRADWPGGGLTPLLDWSEIKTLAEAGVEIGAHGLDHQPLDALGSTHVAQHLAQMQALFGQHLGRRPRWLAYPYGRWSAAAADAARRAGFAYAATARGGRNGAQTPHFKLRRTLVRNHGWGLPGRLRFATAVRTGYAQLAEWRMDLGRVT